MFVKASKSAMLCVMEKKRKINIKIINWYYGCPYKVGKTYTINDIKMRLTRISAERIEHTDYWILEGDEV